VDLSRLNSILLQTFLVVAEAGQISKAARRLHLSQPAVSGHIRRLEADLDTTLLIRSALDQAFELGSTEAVKSLVVAGLGIGFLSCWDRLQIRIRFQQRRRIHVIWRLLRGTGTARPAVLATLGQKKTYLQVL
jgi:DNA-binding transcriptional LysR family regulator